MAENVRWITAAEVKGILIPAGGSTNQVLAKNSDTDFDNKWASVVGAGGILGTIADTQVAFGDGSDISGSDQLTWTEENLNIGVVSIAPDGTVGGMTSVSSTTIDAVTNLTLHNGAVAGLSYQNTHRLIVGDVNHSYMIFGGAESGASFHDVDGHTLYFNTAGGYDFDGGRVTFDYDVTFYDIVKLSPMATPSDPVEGTIYANSDDHHLYFYNGTDWKQLDN